VFAAVSGDVFCEFDYRTLASRAAPMAALEAPAMHLVMARTRRSIRPATSHSATTAACRSTARAAHVRQHRLYDTRMFRDLEPGTRRALTPYIVLRSKAAARPAKYDGGGENVGTPAQLGELDARLRTAG
jgi:MurNAc alpha-1-phosphate uridylyltransferase